MSATANCSCDRSPSDPLLAPRDEDAAGVAPRRLTASQTY
ncbi:hypothetical protein BH20CHL5_BH20CHL5_12300 [soil metagenome]